MPLLWVLGATAFVGTIPLVAGVLLLLSDRTLERLVTPVAAFAAGLVVMWVLTFVEPPV